MRTLSLGFFSDHHGSHRLGPLTLLACALSLAAHAADGLASRPERVEQQVNTLLSHMTLAEKIGQMTQADLLALTNKSDVQRYALGSVLSGGGSDPADNSPATWQKTCREMQEQALRTRLKIPVLYGIDAVHGHNNVNGAVIFPHNIGLGATRNPALVRRAAEVTATEIAATGIHWTFAPCVAVARDIRWGRTYESFGESPDLAGELGAAAVQGFQSPLPRGASMLACAKHFAGDGGTENGVDQGDAVCSEADFRATHLAPYKPAIAAGVGSIMISYSSWNGQKMHGHKHLLTDVLKGELAFDGCLVSDWAAIDQLDTDYRKCIEKSINAGLDMVMIPNGPGQKNNYREFISLLTDLVERGQVARERIDDAVRRILRAKVRMGLFEHPYAEPDLLAEIGSARHRDVARECVRESLVLLKNDQVLPLRKDLKKITVVGSAANDLGVQCGGWTISWQGDRGAAIQGGTTLFAGIRQVLAGHGEVAFSPDGQNLAGAETVILVVGEPPYAEMKGDRTDLRLSPQDTALAARVKRAGVPVVTVLLSGRPMVLGSVLDMSDAFVAAWLPGTEGAGVAEILFGDYEPEGKLPRRWPSSNDDLSPKHQNETKPLFPAGFGLTWPSRKRGGVS